MGGSTVGNAGLRVYSLADPASPTLVGSFRPDHQAVPYYHDIEIRGGRAYAAAIYDGGGVDVLDVSDPSAISLVSTFTYPGAGAHNTCTSEDGNTVYVGDEIGASGNWMRIFDVTDVQDAELVGEIVIHESAAVHNCYVRGDRLFVAHYTEGLRVFDVSEPHFPIEVVSLDTFGGPSRGYRGAWTAYPYFASGKVIVSDIDTGLWVATLDEGATASVRCPTASPSRRGPTRRAARPCWRTSWATRPTSGWCCSTSGAGRSPSSSRASGSAVGTRPSPTWRGCQRASTWPCSPSTASAPRRRR